jgi:hypothetical protein
MTAKELLDAFIERNEFPDGCVLWEGSKTRDGYCQVWWNGGKCNAYVHRYICEAVHGPAPEDKPFSLHSCRNKHCYSPLHLKWGSPKENTADRLRDGTHQLGTRNSSCKLTEEQVLAIRDDARLRRVIMAEYGVGRTTIQYIKSRRSWAWL